MKAIIFDMDGVLVDSEIHWKKVESDFLSGLIPSWDETAQKGIIGMSAHDVYHLLVKEYGLDKSKEEYFGYYQSIAGSIYEEKCSLIQGAKEALLEASTWGHRVGLASSSPLDWIHMVVNRFSLSQFEVLISADHVGGRGKPDPGIYLKTADSLKVLPANCVAIEDTEKGVESALRAGMKSVGFRNGFNEGQDLSKAHLIIDGFSNKNMQIIKDTFSL